MNPLLPFLMAGDPSLEALPRLLSEAKALGLPALELGLPHSDPIADGPVLQAAAQRAINRGATPLRVLEGLAGITDSPDLILFTYLNPIYTYGYDRFHHDAAAAGADGVLVLDLPPDEAAQNSELKPAPDLRHIQLIAPTSPTERIASIAKCAEGFVYYVSRLGVTGAQAEIASGIAEQVAIIKAATQVPVCVGFGVSNPEQAATIASKADGVVVGSAIVKLIEQNGSSADCAAKLEAFVKPLVGAVHAL